MTPCLAHVSIGWNDLDRGKKFYNDLMPSIGCKVIMDLPFATAYGRTLPEFWVQKPRQGERAVVASGSHIAFKAEEKDDVHKFYDKAIELGATCDGKPGPRPEYAKEFYGAFVMDPEGNRIEVMYWDYSAGQS